MDDEPLSDEEADAIAEECTATGLTKEECLDLLELCDTDPEECQAQIEELCEDQLETCEEIGMIGPDDDMDIDLECEDEEECIEELQEICDAEGLSEEECDDLI